MENGGVSMRKIGVVTTSRADYGVYLPILQKISLHPNLKLLLYVTGMHLRPEYGNTVSAIKEDGFAIVKKVDMLSSSDLPLEIAKSMGRGTMGFAEAFKDVRPDILVVLGDRFEMHAAAIAAIPFGIPIAHIHGGELTEGSFDEYFRHSLTKISHLHFASTESYAKRIIQMGEEPWRVVISGAPGLDNIQLLPRIQQKDLEKKFKISFAKPIILATFHPVTLEHEKTEEYIGNFLEAVSSFVDYGLVFTCPNADTSNQIISRKIKHFVVSHTHSFFVENFGQQGYLSMMAYAKTVVGNSSSGVIEAASFKLPVVNIGSRQNGRIKGKNVIDVGYTSSEIKEGLRKALSEEFKNSLWNLTNPYGDGKASERIVETLAKVDLQKIKMKRFYNYG